METIPKKRVRYTRNDKQISNNKIDQRLFVEDQFRRSILRQKIYTVSLYATVNHGGYTIFRLGEFVTVRD